MICVSFQHFYESVVVPLQRANPTHHRLDGWRSGGNRAVAGRFLHGGRRWKVHADTHYEPLALAYAALTASPPRDPFVVAATDRGGRLDLVDEIQRQRGTRFRHLYVYADE